MEDNKKKHVAIMYAVDSSAQRIPAQKGLRGHCEFCKSEVIAKCGEIYRWHWAHTNTGNCDSWAEGETDWHLYWKGLVPKDNVERVILKDAVIHRADILTDDGCVVELQHSPISVEDIRNRESFYGNMVWLFDLQAARARLQWFKPSES